MSEYCTAADLLIDRSTPLPQNTDPGFYITSSSHYMDARLAVSYPTPVTIDATKEGAETDAALLRTICANLASGAIILAVSAGTERHSVHAYGKQLIERGEALLQQLLDGDLGLTTVARKVSYKEVGPVGPLVGHGTSFNMTDGYYHNFEPHGITPGRMKPDEEGGWPFDVAAGGGYTPGSGR